MNYVILTAFAVFAIYPILSIVVAGLQPDAEAPGGLGNLAQAWEIGRFGSYLRTSLLVSAFVVAVSTVLSVLAGFAFGTMRFRGADALFYLMLIGIMMPAEAIVVPLFFDLRAIGLTDTFWAIALPQVAQSVAFGTFWLRAAFRSSSRSVVEAARLDGASTGRILWQVLVPARPPRHRHARRPHLHVDLERVPHPARHGPDQRGAAHGAAGPRVLLGPVHAGLRAARGGRDDRGAAGRRRLPLPPAPLHRRDARGGGQGLTRSHGGP